MAVVITSEELLALLGGETQVGSDVNLAPFITAGSLVVDEDLATAVMSDARKKQIGLFLSAHFATLAIERGGLTRYKVGESTEAYKEGSSADRGFNLTRFGQQAVSLDSTGTLAKNAQPMAKAEFRVV